MTTKGYWARFKKMSPEKKRAQLWGAMRRASGNLRSAKADAADDGMFAMRDGALAVANSRLRRAQQVYDKARAAWEAAGCPDQRGRVTRPKTARPAPSPPTPGGEG